jgi:hypothetical protein
MRMNDRIESPNLSFRFRLVVGARENLPSSARLKLPGLGTGFWSGLTSSTPQACRSLIGRAKRVIIRAEGAPVWFVGVDLLRGCGSPQAGTQILKIFLTDLQLNHFLDYGHEVCQ